jgi:HSP20 family protein
MSESWPANMFSTPVPAINVEEGPDEVVVTAELPGLDKKDFRVQLQDQRLILQGEKKASREEKKRNYYYAESSYGSFYRAIPLPCEVDADHIQANCKHGVLKVRLPKTEKAKASTIQVQVS